MKTKPYSFPYPVADTEAGPKIEWNDFTLNLRFTDYLNTECEVTFEEVSHFEFISEDAIQASQFQYDGVVEIIESDTIEELVRVGEVNENEKAEFHHIAIGFNEIGSYLIVVFKKIKTNQPNNKGSCRLSLRKSN